MKQERMIRVIENGSSPFGVAKGHQRLTQKESELA